MWLFDGIMRASDVCVSCVCSTQISYKKECCLCIFVCMIEGYCMMLDMSFWMLMHNASYVCLHKCDDKLFIRCRSPSRCYFVCYLTGLFTSFWWWLWRLYYCECLKYLRNRVFDWECICVRLTLCNDDIEFDYVNVWFGGGVVIWSMDL